MVTTEDNIMSLATELKQLYETDDYKWLLENINLLKQRRFNELDLENLIEELESLSRSEKNAVESLLEQVIRHLLLYQFWTEEFDHNGHHWRAEIIGFRTQLRRKLTTNLRNHLRDNRELLYQDAVKYIRAKTKFLLNFPEECPYTLERLFDENYL
jgi:hypothetical protein